MSKHALLIGCNYPGTKAALKGCVNDVNNMKRMLTENFAFPPKNIKVLVDVGAGEKPTGKAIKQNLRLIVKACKAGDVLFVHFSGHGTQVADKDGDDADNMDEAIVPTDLNIITDDDLRRILGKLPPKVSLTMVTDCCHSGSMLDHPVQQIYGDKAEGSAVAAEAVQAFGGVDAGAEASNRAMPQTDYLALLSEKLGFDASSGLHQALHRGFGADASTKSLAALGQLSDLAAQLKDKPGFLGKAGGMLGGFLGKVKSQVPAAAAPAAEPVSTGPREPPTPGQGGEGDGALITGCQANETSADACPGGDPSKAYGALTNALTTTVRQMKKANPNAPISYKELVTTVRQVLLQAKFSQNPCLECAADTVDKPFIC